MSARHPSLQTLSWAYTNSLLTLRIHFQCSEYGSTAPNLYDGLPHTRSGLFGPLPVTSDAKQFTHAPPPILLKPANSPYATSLQHWGCKRAHLDPRTAPPPALSLASERAWAEFVEGGDRGGAWARTPGWCWGTALLPEIPLPTNPFRLRSSPLAIENGPSEQLGLGGMLKGEKGEAEIRYYKSAPQQHT